MALIKSQGAVYRGCVNLLARAAGRQVSPGAEVPVLRSLLRSRVALALQILCLAPLSIVTKQELQRKNQTRNQKESTFTGMAQQQHHQNISRFDALVMLQPKSYSRPGAPGEERRTTNKSIWAKHMEEAVTIDKGAHGRMW